MCGFLAVFGTPPRSLHEPHLVAERLRSARDLMCGRGPDCAGEVVIEDGRAGPGWLGHRRLSIQDLSEAGSQPMWSSCGRYVIVYNGEVYNSPSLRAELEIIGRKFASHCDTEVIVEGYAVWGADILPRLHGIFAFVIWDRFEECLFAARDRVGVKPLHYVANEAGIALASDLRVLADLGFAGEIDPLATGVYLCLGYVPTPMSIRRRAAKLEAGTAMIWRPGQFPVRTTYWMPPVSCADHPGDLDTLNNIVDDVVREQLLSDVPIGLFLSGGLDSSLVASSAVRAGAEITALSIGFTSADEDDEFPIAQKTAERLGIPIRHLYLDEKAAEGYTAQAIEALDEPLAFSAVVSQMAVSQAASAEGYKVVLSGDGGDEVFGGYRWYEMARPASPATANLWRAAAYRLIGTSKLRFLRNTRDRHLEATFRAKSEVHAHARQVFPTLRPDEVPEVLEGLSEACVEEAVIDALRRHDAPDLPLKRRLQRIDLMTFCSDVVLAKVDRTSMAVGLEVRPPLLDHRIVEWGLSQPISERCDSEAKMQVRTLLKLRGLGHLLSEKKRGFSLKGSASPSVTGLKAELSNEFLTASHGFHPNWIDRLAPQSNSYKMRLQTVNYMERWLKGSDVQRWV